MWIRLVLFVLLVGVGQARAELDFTVLDTHPRIFTEEQIEQLRSSCGIAHQAEWPDHWQTQETRIWDPLVDLVEDLPSTLVSGTPTAPKATEWIPMGTGLECAAGVYMLGRGQGGDADAAAVMARDKLYDWLDDLRADVEAYGSFTWADDQGAATEGAGYFGVVLAYDVLYNEGVAGTTAEQDRIEWLCHFIYGLLQEMTEYRDLLGYSADHRKLAKLTGFLTIYGDPELDSFEFLGGERGPASVQPPDGTGPRDYSLAEIEQRLTTLKSLVDILWHARALHLRGARVAYPEDGQPHPFEDIWASFAYRAAITDAPDPWVEYAGHFAMQDEWTIRRVTSVGHSVGHRSDGWGRDGLISGSSNYISGYHGSSLSQDQYSAGIMDRIIDQYYEMETDRSLFRMLVVDDRSFPHTFPTVDEYPPAATLTDLTVPFEDGGRGPYTFFRSDWSYVSGDSIFEHDAITAVLHAGPNNGLGHDPAFAAGQINVQMGPTRGWNRGGIYFSSVDPLSQLLGSCNAVGNSLRIIAPNQPLASTEVPIDLRDDADNYRRRWEVRVGAQLPTPLRTFNPYDATYFGSPGGRAFAPVRVKRLLREHVDRFAVRFPGTPDPAAYSRVDATWSYPNPHLGDDPYYPAGTVHPDPYITSASQTVDFILADPDVRSHGFFVVAWRAHTIVDGCTFILPQWAGEKDLSEYALNDGTWDGGTTPDATYGGTPLQTSSDAMSWKYVFRPEGSSDATASTWSTTLAYTTTDPADIHLRRIGGLANDGDANHAWSFFDDGGHTACPRNGYGVTDPIPGTWRGNIDGESPPPSNPTYRWGFPEAGVYLGGCYGSIGSPSDSEYTEGGNAHEDSVWASPRFFRYEWQLEQATAGPWAGVQVWEVEHGVATTTAVTSLTAGAGRIALEIGTGIIWNGSADFGDDTGTTYQTSVVDQEYRHHLEGMAPGLYAILQETPGRPERLYHAESRETEGTLSFATPDGGRFTIERVDMIAQTE